MKKNDTTFWIQTIIPSLSLFTSLGTLLCCALPALLVTLGMGAILAGLIGVFPYITFISDYKEYIFIISGILIFFGFFSQWRTKSFSCPSDPVKAKLLEMNDAVFRFDPSKFGSKKNKKKKGSKGKKKKNCQI